MRSCFLLLAFAMIALSSCAALGGPGAAARGDSQPPFAGLPPLPDDAGQPAARQVSTGSLFLAGDQFYDKSAAAQVEPGLLVFTPDLRELDYGIYQFPMDAGDLVDTLAYYVKERGGVIYKVWMGVANYADNRWEFAPGTAADTFQYKLQDSPESYRSPGGNFYAVIIAYSNGFKVQGLELWKSNLPDAQSAWPMLGHDARRTGRSSESVVDSANLLWKYQTDAIFADSAPVVSAGGTVYLGSLTLADTGILFALNPNGTERFTFPVNGTIYSSPAVGPDGSVYFGYYDNRIAALNSSGLLRWRFLAGREVTSSPAIGPDGRIYFGSIDFKLYAVKPDGSEAWSYATDAGIYGGPALAPDGTVYCSNSQGKLYALDADGALKWVFPAAGRADSTPCVGTDGTIYFGTRDGNFYAVWPDGNLRGIYAAGGEFYGSPALGTGGQVYAGNTNGNLYVFAADAALDDTYTAAGPLKASPLIDGGGRIVVATTTGHLAVLGSDLAPLWEFDAGEELRATPCIGPGGVLYVAGLEGTLFAFDENLPQAPSAPTGLSATDGTQIGKIVLTWDEGYDADGYHVYKDGGADPVATLGYVQYWEDVVADTGPHTYKLKAFNDTGESAFSNEDSGFAASGLVLSSWCQGRGDPARSDCSSVAGPASTPTDSVIDFGGSNRPSPVAFGLDGTLYVKHFWGKLFAYDPGGTQLWDYDIADNASLSACVGIGGVNYVKVGDTVEAVSPLGAQDWAYAPTDGGTGVEVAGLDAGGRLYCCTFNDGKLRCLNPDGSEAWIYPTGCQNEYLQVAVGSDGTVYLGDHKQGLLALNADGSFKWLYPDDAAADADPYVRTDAVNGDMIYIGSTQGLICVDAGGQFVWYAHDSLDNHLSGRPAIAPDGTLFMIYGNGWLRALDSADGLLRKQVTLPEQAESTCLVADSGSNVYVMTHSGARSYDRDLNERWHCNTVSNFYDSSPAIGPDGKLYANDYQHKLHIFSVP